jgi:hypothetical protein
MNLYDFNRFLTVVNFSHGNRHFLGENLHLLTNFTAMITKTS